MTTSPFKHKRPRRTTPKQILVRDFNWRMGNLKRLMANCEVLTWPRRHQAKAEVHNEMTYQASMHKWRLGVLDGSINPGTSTELTLTEAFRQAERQNAEADAFGAAALQCEGQDSKRDTR